MVLGFCSGNPQVQPPCHVWHLWHLQGWCGEGGASVFPRFSPIRSLCLCKGAYAPRPIWAWTLPLGSAHVPFAEKHRAGTSPAGYSLLGAPGTRHTSRRTAADKTSETRWSWEKGGIQENATSPSPRKQWILRRGSARHDRIPFLRMLSLG